MTPVSDSKVSSCADCALPIIGGRLRCPACHQNRSGSRESFERSLFAWAVLVESLAAIACGIALVVKGCA